LSNPEKYRRLVGKLNYFIFTRPDISFAVSVVSQFVNSPCVDNWNAVKYIKGSPGKGLLYGHSNHSIQMLIGQDLCLIEDLLLYIFLLLVII